MYFADNEKFDRIHMSLYINKKW